MTIDMLAMFSYNNFCDRFVCIVDLIDVDFNYRLVMLQSALPSPTIC